MENECNVLFNNEHLILIYFFLLIDTYWIWFENYFYDIKFRKSSSILMKIRKMLLFSTAISHDFTLYYICYVILAMYMLDQEPS